MVDRTSAGQWWMTLAQLMQGYSKVLPVWVCSIWCNTAIPVSAIPVYGKPQRQHAVSLCRQYPTSEPFLNQVTLWDMALLKPGHFVTWRTSAAKQHQECSASSATVSACISQQKWRSRCIPGIFTFCHLSLEPSV